MRVAGCDVLCVLQCACCRVGCAVRVAVRMLQGGVCCAYCRVGCVVRVGVCVLQGGVCCAC